MISKEELISSERKFLHDIANHLVVAQGMTSFVIKSLKEEQKCEPREIERLEKAFLAISKMSDSLKARREFHYALAEEEAKNKGE